MAKGDAAEFELWGDKVAGTQPPVNRRVAVRIDCVMHFKQLGHTPPATELVMKDGTRYVVVGTFTQVWDTLYRPDLFPRTENTDYTRG